jgi:hypothetical protein
MHIRHDCRFQLWDRDGHFSSFHLDTHLLEQDVIQGTACIRTELETTDPKSSSQATSFITKMNGGCLGVLPGHSDVFKGVQAT